MQYWIDVLSCRTVQGGRSRSYRRERIVTYPRFLDSAADKDYIDLGDERPHEQGRVKILWCNPR
jgi:hypothetical protein